MSKYVIGKITERPDMIDKAADWFHEKWRVPCEACLASMIAAMNGDAVQEWYLCWDGDAIIAGLGGIAHVFHERKDLTPHVCAVYTEKQYRGKGIGGRLLNFAVADNKAKGISPLHLVTDHMGFYEGYGWQYVCMVQGDDAKNMSRMYVHN